MPISFQCTSWCLALIISSRNLIRWRVSSFVREAGSIEEAFRPRFVLAFLVPPPFDSLFVVKLLAPLLLTDGDVLATESAGRKFYDKLCAASMHAPIIPAKKEHARVEVFFWQVSLVDAHKLDASIDIRPAIVRLLWNLTPPCCGVSCSNAAAVRVRCPQGTSAFISHALHAALDTFFFVPRPEILLLADSTFDHSCSLSRICLGHTQKAGDKLISIERP